ncbi:MAG: NADH-quinone oxidoreductase subunit A [Planctomycetota bacterium]|nr:NADH-quinone oxidoreductase subunit A [Planctomycetota bacterium]MEE3199022.1 NADH-quinone oxidoreductase subunit A [Planctomycetota bacterium]
MGYQLLNVLVFTLFGIFFVVLTVSILSRLLRPRVRSEDEPGKLETYECGEPTIGSSWVRFDIRFYSLALIFLIFDVEVAFLYPWALVFKTLMNNGFGGFIFLEVLVFLCILMVGFVYCWAKGDLDWLKVKPFTRAAVVDETPEPAEAELPEEPQEVAA